MPAIARLNKSTLSQKQKRQVRTALRSASNISVVTSDIVSKATLGTTLVDINSTTAPTADASKLRFEVKAGNTYIVEAVLSAVCTTNNGVKLGLTGPTAGVIRGRTLDDATYALYDAFSDVLTEAAAAGTALNGHFLFAYKPTADGVLRVQFAEETSHADTVTIKAGSFLSVREVLS